MANYISPKKKVTFTKLKYLNLLNVGSKDYRVFILVVMIYMYWWSVYFGSDDIHILVLHSIYALASDIFLGFCHFSTGTVTYLKFFCIKCVSHDMIFNRTNSNFYSD